MPAPWLEELADALRAAPAERRVLVVEDSDALAQTLASVLQDLGYRVSTAGTLADGLTQLESFRPAVVLVDKNLPDGSGLDLLRDGRAGQGAFLVMTGHASDDSAREAARLGAFGYLAKPFESIHDVTRRVRAAAERERVSRLAALVPDAWEAAIDALRATEAGPSQLRALGNALTASAHLEADLHALTGAPAGRLGLLRAKCLES